MSKTGHVTKKVGVALYGAGTVGGAVLDALDAMSAYYAQTTGVRFEVRHVVAKERTRGRYTCTQDLHAPLNDPKVELVVELMGGDEPAKTIIESALKSGRSVVTANKAVIAKYGKSLLASGKFLNKDGELPLYFEASVAGGIPVIGPIISNLRSSRIHKLMAIINGTTNYILTRMEQEGLDLPVVLADAQKLGYAEADASFDVDGHDALHKLTILASLLSGTFMDWKKIHREGIAHISDLDIEYAQELGYRIKLLAIVHQEKKGKVDARVHPALLPLHHPLANVEGVLNGVYMEGEPLGPLMLVGRGAGGGPTASSVISDMLNAAIHSPPPLRWHQDAALLPIEETINRYYLRMRVKDNPGRLAQIATVLGRYGVSIQSIIQKGGDAKETQIVWITHPVAEKAMQMALKEITKTKLILKIEALIRVEDGLKT